MKVKYQILEQKDTETNRIYLFKVFDENDTPSETFRLDIPLVFNKTLSETTFKDPITYYINNNVNTIQKTVLLTFFFLFTVLSVTVRDIKFMIPIGLFISYFFINFIRTYKENREKYFEQKTIKKINEKVMKANLEEFIQSKNYYEIL